MSVSSNLQYIIKGLIILVVLRHRYARHSGTQVTGGRHGRRTPLGRDTWVTERYRGSNNMYRGVTISVKPR